MTRTKKTAAPHDIWADALVCDISASVVLRGPQAVAVRRGEDARGRQVAVQVGRVLVYAYDGDAVTGHLTSWRRAAGLAVRAFPPDYEAQGPRDADAPDRPRSVGSVVLQCEREQRPVRVDAATTMAAGLPYVQVQVGRLIVVCLDQAALDAVLTAWGEADELAGGWLPDVDAAREQRRVIAAFEKDWKRDRAESPAPQ